MPDKKSKSFYWSNINEKAQKILGDEFWNEISHVLPRKGISIDMYESNNEVVVVGEVPGISSSSNVSIYLNGFILVIKGNIPWTYPISKNDMIQQERFIGEFNRKIQLPHSIDVNSKPKAKFKNGLIEIHIPKCQQYKEKEVTIQFEE